MTFEKLTNAKIMVIDEDVAMMEILKDLLETYHHTVTINTNVISAIEKLKVEEYDILLINYLMTPINGDRVVEIIREFNKDIYIILMSTHKDLIPSIETMNSLDIQAYFEKSSRFDQLIMQIQTGIKYVEQVKNLKKANIQLEEYVLDFADVLLKTVDAKDNFTASHSLRVSKLTILFAKYLNLSHEQIESLRLAGLFHDIGKIGIADSILKKDNGLTNEEYDIMKLHTIIGANIFSVSSIFKDVVPAIYSHHEKYDGSGYPEKLKADNIPFLARVLAITDAFDAIVSKRPYKEAMSFEYGIEKIKESSGKSFDPILTKDFLDFYEKNKNEIKEICNG